MQNFELEKLLNSYLEISKINDYAPNGLQIEGKKQISFIVTGVSASQELIDFAVKNNADALIVHHGYFWKNENPIITGIKQKRIKTLLQHNINLYAYHLPLDIHKTLGNNVLWAKALGINDLQPLQDQTPSIPQWGLLAQQKTITEFTQSLIAILGHERIFYCGNNKKKVHKVGLCTGAGQDFIEDAVAAGCDTYISGEISERTVLIAKESGIHYFACGHHVTERFGIKALGDWLQRDYGLKVVFKDCYNPI